MPPQVVAEIVAVVEPRLALADPRDPLAAPVLHLHDVRDRVHRPQVGRVALDRGPAGTLRLVVGARLLERERVHAEDVAVAVDGIVPGVQHPADRISVVLVVAEIEVEIVGELQRDDVARMLGENRLEVRDGALELSAAPCVEGVEVAALAVRGATLRRGLAGGLEAPARLAGQRRHAEEHEEVPFHAVREDHLRILGEGVLEAVSGFLSKPQVLRECRVEAAHRRIACGGRLESACIQHHGLHRGNSGRGSWARRPPSGPVEFSSAPRIVAPRSGRRRGLAASMWLAIEANCTSMSATRGTTPEPRDGRTSCRPRYAHAPTTVSLRPRSSFAGRTSPEDGRPHGGIERRDGWL